MPQRYLHTEAAKWYHQAAEQGVAEAQFNIGGMYFFGDGVPQSDIIAHMWLNLASANGLAPAAVLRDKLSQRMTREQIAKAQAMAAECLNKEYKNVTSSILGLQNLGIAAIVISKPSTNRLTALHFQCWLPLHGRLLQRLG
ncbi:MAG: sel1 repeat family protein [Methylophaga sp.]|nr:sel1 repeat family protein [Methylophaga sp.]